MLIRWLRWLLGQHPNPYSEARYQLERGPLPIDRLFLWVDIGFCALAFAQFVVEFSQTLIPVVLCRVLRFITVIRLIRRPATRVPDQAGYLAFTLLAAIEAPLLIHMSYFQGLTFSPDAALFAHAMPLAAFLGVHPLFTRARLAIITVTVSSYGFWLWQWDQTNGSGIHESVGFLVLFSVAIVSSLLERQKRQGHTRFRALSRRLRQQNSALRRAQKTADSRHAQLKASVHWQRDAMLTNVARTVVHELAQPVSAASNVSYLLKQQTEDDNPALNTIESNLARVRKALVEYRAFFLRGHDEINQAHTDLADAIEDAIALINDRDRPFVRITTQVPEGLRLQVEQLGLALILTNLLNNAGRAASKTNQPCTVEITASAQESTAHIQVSNTGPGIDSATAEQLFKHRAQSSDGTGIGLYVAKAVLNNVGGDIQLSERSPVRFEIKIPIANTQNPQ